MSAILDGFMRGYNFGDSIQQRAAERQWQGEVRDRQRQDWQLEDQTREIAEIERETHALLGNRTMEEAAADPASKPKLIELTDRLSKITGQNKRKMGTSTVRDVVPTGNGRVTAVVDIKNDKGEVVSTGPITANQTNGDNDPVVDWDANDFFRALRAKSASFNKFATDRENTAAKAQAVTDFIEGGAPSTSPSAPSTQRQGLRAAAAATPPPAPAGAGMGNYRYAVNSVDSPTLPRFDNATGATHTLIEGDPELTPQKQTELNAYLDASVEKGRAARQGKAEFNAVEPKAPAAPIKYVGQGKNRRAVRVAPEEPDPVTPGSTRFARRKAAAEARSAKDEVPSAKSEDQTARVSALEDGQAKKVAAEVRAPKTQKQLEGVQKQVENIRPSGITSKQKKALAQLFRLGAIDAATYERAYRTGHLSERETEQVKLDASTLLVDSETGEVLRTYNNPAQAMVTSAADAQKDALKLEADKGKFIEDNYGFLAQDHKGKIQPERFNDVKDGVLIAADTLGFNPYQQNAVPIFRQAKRLQESYEKENGPSITNLWLKDEPKFSSYTPGVIAQQTGLDMSQTIDRYYKPVRAALGPQADGLQSKAALVIAGLEKNGVPYEQAVRDTLSLIAARGSRILDDPAALVRHATQRGQ
jgi:hypothetical protein